MSLYYDLLPRHEAAPINQVYLYFFLIKHYHSKIYYIYQTELKMHDLKYL